MPSRRTLLQTAAWAAALGAGSRVGTAATVPEGSRPSRLVGAHYYPWYGPDNHWENGYVGTPRLGEYDSGSETVVREHMRMTANAGIDWLNVAWWGPESYSGGVLEDVIAPTLAGSDLSFAALYETLGRFERTDGTIDLSAAGPRATLAADLTHIAETLVSTENYLHVDGRPVLYIYVADTLSGDIGGAFADAQQAAGVEYYLIGDVGRTATQPHPVFDAVSPYAMYRSVAGVDEWFEAYVEQRFRGWHLLAREADFEFIPNTMPGFDKTGSRRYDGEAVLQRSPERYERVSRLAAQYATGDPQMVLITSFNEWHEFTSIEPGVAYGDTYLQITDRVFSAPLTEPPALALVPLHFRWDSYVAESAVNPEISPGAGRRLTIAVYRLACLDAGGGQLAAYDIGTPTAELVTTQGIDQAESHSTRSWRWFVANRNMVSTLYLPEAVAVQTHTVVLSCRAPTDGFAFTVQLGQQGRRVPVRTDTGWDDVAIRLASQEREPQATGGEPAESEQLSTGAPDGTEGGQTDVGSGGFGLLASVIAAGAGSAWLWWRGRDD
jgi:hypothetical protein